MTPKPRFDLYAFWRTSATYRVRVALNLKGIQAHEKNVNLDSGENRSAEFLKINPLGAIPAMVDNDASASHAPMTQSSAILEFLEEACPKPSILPSDLYGRARVRSLGAMLTADTHPLVTGRIKKYLVTNADFDDAAWRAWQINWFTVGLQAFEARLASEKDTGTFCHGEAPGMADICLASIIVVMRVFKIDVAEIPHINRIMAECERHPAFADADPARQVGAPVQK